MELPSNEELEAEWSADRWNRWKREWFCWHRYKFTSCM